MPEQLNRSPCLTRLPLRLCESVRGQVDPTQTLTEARAAKPGRVTLSEATQDGKKVTRFRADIAKVDIINRNGRYYPRSAYEAAIIAAEDDLGAGRLWGLLEHADDWADPMKGRLEKIAGRFDTLSIDGDMVVGEGVIVETASGRDLRALFEGGIAVGISTSGTGSVKWLPAKEVAPDHHDPEALIGVIQDDFRLLTVDFVSDPANPSGAARASERRQRPAPTRPQEGSMKWNAKVKKTAERLGLTAEAFAEQHPEWAQELQQESAVPAPAPTENGTVSLDAYRALENRVVGLTSNVETLTTQLQNERRDSIAITALESARLPSAGKFKDGDTEIDLDASFRAELITVARTAESDDLARSAVEGKITQRRAVLGQREGTAAPRGTGRLPVPVGDNSRTQTEQERRNSGTATRQIENARSGLGLI